MPDIMNMIGKEVEIMANGVLYTGVLIEISDAEVHLKCPFQWVSLPTSSVGEIRLKGEAAGRVLEKFEGWEQEDANRKD